MKRVDSRIFKALMLVVAIVLGATSCEKEPYAEVLVKTQLSLSMPAISGSYPLMLHGVSLSHRQELCRRWLAMLVRTP